MALGSEVHLWSESAGQRHIPGHHDNLRTGQRIYLAKATALAYSSDNQWLAIARADGLIQLHGRKDRPLSAEINVAGDVSCMAFQPSHTLSNDRKAHLLIGGHTGHIFCLSVLSPSESETRRARCHLMKTITSAHTEQVT